MGCYRRFNQGHGRHWEWRPGNGGAMMMSRHVGLTSEEARKLEFDRVRPIDGPGGPRASRRSLAVVGMWLLDGCAAASGYIAPHQRSRWAADDREGA